MPSVISDLIAESAAKGKKLLKNGDNVVLRDFVEEYRTKYNFDHIMPDGPEGYNAEFQNAFAWLDERGHKPLGSIDSSHFGIIYPIGLAEEATIAVFDAEDTKPTPVVSTEIQLSDEQLEAKELILEWLNDSNMTSPQEFRLGGYAGTGKTTLIKAIMAEIDLAIGVGAFTGKAVNVLRKKGVFNAQTLHSMLYKAEIDPETKKIKWVPRIVLPFDLIIVDEASMVSTSLYDDLTSHDVKLLFVGDPAQLEPVGDNPNLMRDCDFVLENIHRQAAGNPILALAADIRKGKGKLKLGKTEGKDGNGSLTITNRLSGLDVTEFDVMICSKNATRHAMNEKYRIKKKLNGPPKVGERIICLRNDKNQGLFNGMILTILSIRDGLTKNFFIADLVDEAGDEYDEVWVQKEFFGKDYKSQAGDRGKALPFDFAYCLTTHKSQGSEWDNVLNVDENLWKVDRNRMRYTAFTRAAKSLTVVLTDAN